MTGSDLVPAEVRDEVRKTGRRLFVWWMNTTVVLIGVMIFGVRMGDVAANFHNRPEPSFPTFSWTRTTEMIRMPPAEPGGPVVERTLVLPHRVDAPKPAAQPPPRPKPAGPMPLRVLLAALLIASWSAMIVLLRRSPVRTRAFVARWFRADWLFCGLMLLAGALQLTVVAFVATGARWSADAAVHFRGTLLVAVVMLVVLRLFFRPGDTVFRPGDTVFRPGGTVSAAEQSGGAP